MPWRSALAAKMLDFPTQTSVFQNLQGPWCVSQVEYLAVGDNIEDLLAEFPDLEREDLLACLKFADAD
jgi:hypothetical protein